MTKMDAGMVIKKCVIINTMRPAVMSAGGNKTTQNERKKP